MDKENLRRFLRRLAPNGELIDSGDWLNTNCPLSPWTHEKGKDRSPSFGVHVVEGGTSLFHCFSCHRKGNLKYLLDLLEDYSGQDYSDLRKELGTGELLSPTIHSEWTEDRSLSHPAPAKVDPAILDYYPSAEGHWYLEERDISDATAKALDLRIDPSDSKGCERLLFPVYTPSQDFCGFTGRATSHTARPKVRDYFGLDKRLLLLGSHLLDPGISRPVVLVEGLIDFAIVYQCGYDVVASMHAALTERQADILKSIGRPVIVFYDNDKAGREGTDSVVEELFGFVPVLSVDYADIGASPHEALDPGSLHDSELDTLISSARLCSAG